VRALTRIDRGARVESLFLSLSVSVRARAFSAWGLERARGGLDCFDCFDCPRDDDDDEDAADP
jgi:hypothetical protein